MSSNNQTVVKDVDFEADGVIFFEPIGNDAVYHLIGEFDGATVYVEECGIHWEHAGFGKGNVVIVEYGTAAEDTTTAKTIALTWQWDTADIIDTITLAAEAELI